MITIYFMRKKKTKDQAEIFREESRRNKMVVQRGAGGLIIYILCSAPACTCTVYFYSAVYQYQMIRNAIEQ